MVAQQAASAMARIREDVMEGPGLAALLYRAAP